MEVLTILTTVCLPLLVLYLLHYLRPALRVIHLALKIPTAGNCWPIVGHIRILMVPPNRLISLIEELYKTSQLPFVVWVGPVPVLPVTKPKHIEALLNNTKYMDKMFNYRFLHPWLGTGLLTSTGSKWQTHRKIITPAFHFKIMENFIDVFAQKSRNLVKKLEKEVGSADFDISPYISLCALDVILETTMGVEIDTQTQQYVNACCEMTNEIMSRSRHPWLYPDSIYKYSPSGKRAANYIKILHGLSNRVISHRRKLFENRNPDISSEEDIAIGRKKKLAFLDILLESSENSMTDEEIREQVDTFMFAGHDTSSATMCWALQLLASHPEIQVKVCDELDNIFQGSDRSATMQDLTEMKYLERVIKETLRLYPSVPIIGRELKEDVIIDDYTIPCGMNIAIVPYLTHRDEEQYPYARVFNPDNFLPENVASRHPYAYIPFSAGPRNCIGQKFAMLEIKMTLSSILRCYTLKAIGDLPTPIPDVVLRPENGVHIQIAKRILSI